VTNLKQKMDEPAIFIKDLKNFDDSKTIDDFKYLLEGVNTGNSKLFLKDGGIHPLHSVNIANERNRVVYAYTEALFALKEATKILTAQAKHPCDCIEHQNVWYESSPAYGWLKKWGINGIK